MIYRCLLAALALLGLLGRPVAAQEHVAGRLLLPDYSHGTTGILGPFLWGRSLDWGEDARFSNVDGTPSDSGGFLWCHQFNRMPQDRSIRGSMHGRNNFISLDDSIAYTLQPAHFLINKDVPHNAKIIFGYIDKSFRFQHGDNTDLAHLAGGDRVCVFFPVRFNEGDRRRLEQDRYFVNTMHPYQSFCVIEFKKGEMIQYGWFKDPANLDPHILFDLAPYFSGSKALQPGVTKPLLKFDIDGQGGWSLRIERDGRDGLAGGEVEGDWDLSFTHQSPGARPYTVNITRQNSAWTLSTFSPGGKPADTSEFLIGLQPYNRETGKSIPWGDRTRRVHDLRVSDLDAPPATAPAAADAATDAQR